MRISARDARHSASQSYLVMRINPGDASCEVPEARNRDLLLCRRGPSHSTSASKGKVLRRPVELTLRRGQMQSLRKLVSDKYASSGSFPGFLRRLGLELAIDFAFSQSAIRAALLHGIGRIERSLQGDEKTDCRLGPSVR